MTRRALALVSLLPLALVLAACGGAAKSASNGGTTGSRTAAISRAHLTGELADLHSVAQLTSLFDAGAGEPRLVVLMSPT